MNSDFGVELYRLIISGFPGTPQKTVAAEKLLTVHAGMKREDVLALLGPPQSITTIDGLDVLRESWTYQVPFGRQYTVRLDGGVVAGPAAVIDPRYAAPVSACFAFLAFANASSVARRLLRVASASGADITTASMCFKKFGSRMFVRISATNG